MKYLGPPQSGSQANTTASHNRAGQYFRNRRKPVTPTRTSKQGVLRGKFGSASAYWQTLTPDLQAAWTAFAAGYPVVDALGQTVVLTGQQYFIGLQTSLLNAGQAMVDTVPSNVVTPPVDSPMVSAQDSGAVIVGVGTLGVGDFNLVALSKILSNGRNFNKGFSQFAVLTFSELIQDVGEAFAAQYGAPVVGKKIFARFKEVNSSGMSGPNLIIQQPVVTSHFVQTPSTTNLVTGTVVSTIGGSGTTQQAIFTEAVNGQGYVQAMVVDGILGVATFPGIVTGLRAYTRATDGTLYGPKSPTFIVS
jgi:hypothetical protein